MLNGHLLTTTVRPSRPCGWSSQGVPSDLQPQSVKSNVCALEALFTVKFVALVHTTLDEDASVPLKFAVNLITVFVLLSLKINSVDVIPARIALLSRPTVILLATF